MLKVSKKMTKTARTMTQMTNKYSNIIGDLLYDFREKNDLTQDQFGQRYSVSGPAIFKFEKGYVKPSLELWMKMARDMGIEDRRSIFIWTHAKLPEEYKHHIDFLLLISPEPKRGSKKEVDYAALDTSEKLKEAVQKDAQMPEPLRELLMDEQMFSLFRPTGPEIQYLRNQYANVGKGSVDLYRQALMLLRSFKNTH